MPSKEPLPPEDLPFILGRVGRFVQLVAGANVKGEADAYENARIVGRDCVSSLGFFGFGLDIPGTQTDVDDRSAIALELIPFILHSDRMSHEQKVSAVATYPDFLLAAELSGTRFTAESEVRNFLLGRYVSELYFLTPPSKRGPITSVYTAVSAQWRQQRKERIIGWFNRMTAHNRD